jgi:hypothetical protein
MDLVSQVEATRALEDSRDPETAGSRCCEAICDRTRGCLPEVLDDSAGRIVITTSVYLIQYRPIERVLDIECLRLCSD